MTRLFDDPAAFAEDALEGFTLANADLVTRVPGGVVRAFEPSTPKVAVIVGGGSGHYPAFYGVVGQGFADGAVVGNVFTSPSTDDALGVCRAADSGRGVLLTYGNYAGDVLNFGLAADRLRDEGVDARTVLVTDDIASAGIDEKDRRRGIAGDFVVFKMAGAAAEAGYDLDGVERVATLANERTRTLGVAFDGCTLPGQDAPLFHVPSGEMGVGLGIHGEPGVSEEPMPTASELAERLVLGVLAERPEGATRVAAILNGLGSTKYEELFVTWRTVSRLLTAAGLTVVEPEVGELVTSLDMAGCSLTLCFLDDELETLWRAAAQTPAYKKGTASAAGATGQRRATAAVAVSAAESLQASAESRATAGSLREVLEEVVLTLIEHERELGDLDAIAGDGDHGRGMVRGAQAALEAADAAVVAGAGAGALLERAGAAWAARAGGTSGVLWGAALEAAGASIGNFDEPDARGIATALDAALAQLQRIGKASLGDKTMLDALIPFVAAFAESVAGGADTATALAAASVIARDAAQATAALSPRLGRARPLAARSIGHPDPGAVSLALVIGVVDANHN